ncbi:MAG TPA: DNA repair protein RadA [Candidatus Limnocylindrales bacterium]|nr:DNA repair protein RadA [Candidatus Limnocylindrales bacterium]
MPAVRSIYVCQQCGGESPKWAGQCPSCEAWNTLVETVVSRTPATASARGRGRAAISIGPDTVSPIADVESAEAGRLASGIGEVDRVLGGGFVPGSIVLFGGDPGIGKSTLLLQLAARLATAGNPTLYITGEESVAQVRGRAERVNGVVSGLGLVATTELETAIGAIQSVDPALAVVDSVQTMTSADLGGPSGSVGQVREVATRLAEVAKAGRTCVALVGHVTKEGTVAGPRTLEHLVDAVVYLEGERLGSTRLVRAAKNRFGSTDEVGVLEMRGDGLIEVADASRFFLESEQPPVAGTAVTIALEGSRPLAVEIQALVAPSGAGSPRRATTGIDVNRVLMLIAVLARHAGVNLTGHDVYVNVAGGLRIEEPSADLAVAAALASSLRERPVLSGTVLAGELSLAGRVRHAGRAERRLAEARRIGFDRLVTGPVRDSAAAGGAEMVEAIDLRTALALALQPG